MRKIAGGLLMGVGTVLVCGALGLFLWNRWEDACAGAYVDYTLPQIVTYVEDGAGKEEEAAESTEMTEVMIDGYAYIGYVSIPALGLELPVMSEWDYDRLKIAPCRYSGSTKTDDLVLCAHNYSRHFGNIKNLTVGDSVCFTDMDKETVWYEVASVDILEPGDVEAMTDGSYGLTLFTCTYGGASRVTVRCLRVGVKPDGE